MAREHRTNGRTGSSSTECGAERSAIGSAFVDVLVRDARYAIRVFRQRPLVTTVILLTLAIGIGANTAIFSFVDAIVLKPLPYPNAGRIVSIWERRPTGQANAMSALN